MSDFQEAQTFFEGNPEAAEVMLRDVPLAQSKKPKPKELSVAANVWPSPLAPDAFHGLAGQIVKTIEPHSEADPAALLAQTLTAFGNIIGRNPHFVAEADRHGANLFSALVGVSSKARKGSAWGHIRRLSGAVDPEWASNRIMGGLSSGEGLIWNVRDPIEKQEAIRESRRVVGYQTVIEDQGIADKRLLIVEPEFASPLKVMSREGSTLSPILRQAWDSGDLRILTKNSPAKATDSHISLVSHCTRDELMRFLSSTESSNGFANRFLWFCVRRSKCLPEGGNIQHIDFAPIIRKLKRAVTSAITRDEIRRDTTAAAMWREIYPELSEGKPGLLGSVTSRAEAQVMRLALIYALLDESEFIRKEHLLAASSVWDYCEASERYIFGDALGYPEADLILNTLRKRPAGMTRTEISKLFDRHRSAREIETALAALAEYGLANCSREKTDGRPVECWNAMSMVAKQAKEAS